MLTLATRCCSLLLTCHSVQTTIRAEIAAAAQVLQSPAEVDDAVDADLEDKVKNDTVAQPKNTNAANGNGAAAATAPAKKSESGEVAFASKHAHKAKKVKL